MVSEAIARPASHRQLGYLKNLVSDRGVMANIDYESLSSFEASKLIEKVKGTPKGGNGSHPVVKSTLDMDETSIRIMHGMVFKLVFQAANTNGDIPASKEDLFKQTVAKISNLYLESLRNVKANIPKQKTG
jgi:hypothetical protein